MCTLKQHDSHMCVSKQESFPCQPILSHSLAIRWTTDGVGNQYLIMELLSLGALDTFLRSQGPTLANHTRLAICEQLVSAMCELVTEGLTHGDLAVRNVLVKSMTPVHVKASQKERCKSLQMIFRGSSVLTIETVSE